MIITLILPKAPAYSETFFRSKIEGLQESGHQVILVTAQSSEKFDGCKHLYHPRVNQNKLLQSLNMLINYLSLLPYLRNIVQYCKLERKDGVSIKRILEKIYLNSTLLKLKCDWIHFGFATMGVDRETVGRAIGAKTAVSLRGYDIDVYPLDKEGVYKKLWCNLDKVHSISNYLINKAEGMGLPFDKPKQIITPAVNVESLPNCSKMETTAGQKLQLMTIARLHWIKGIDDLISAATLLKSANVDFEWSIVGDGDKKHQERYKFKVYEEELQGHVKFLGKCSHQQTLKALCESSIYVQTSLSEGFCNAVLEAQALGKLCIVTYGGALSENILDGKTGWIVPRLNPESLFRKIVEIDALDLQVKEQFSQNAKERVRVAYGIAKQKREFNRFYAES